MKFIHVAKNQEICVTTASRKNPSEAELLKLASMHPGLETKVHVRAVLQANGFAGSQTNIEALLGAHRKLRELKSQAAAKRLELRLGHLPQACSVSTQQTKEVLLPLGTPFQRLEAAREQAVIAAAKQCMKHGAPGGTRFVVRVTTETLDVKYSVALGSNWNTYAGRFKGWAANVDCHFITVPRDWRIRVEREGLAAAGGMLTLDAQRLQDVDCIKLYKATWAKQSRGYKVELCHGVMAVFAGQIIHAKNVDDAVASARKKLKSLLNKAMKTWATLDDDYQDGPGQDDAFTLDVTSEDARKTGASAREIEAWCHAVGIDTSLRAVPVRCVLKAFSLRPDPKALMAVNAAIERCIQEANA